MKKRSNISSWDDIPRDVLWVLTLPKAVGAETYDKADDIIRKYPEWFPWETKYNSIPSEVHESYRKEKYLDIDKPIECGEGLLAEMNKSHFGWKDYTLRDILKAWEDNKKEERLRSKADKELWDKHYAKYGLEYVE